MSVTESLDARVACAALRALEKETSLRTLLKSNREVRIWWNNNKTSSEEAKRKLEELEKKKLILAKLTPAEIKALSIKL